MSDTKKEISHCSGLQRDGLDLEETNKPCPAMAALEDKLEQSNDVFAQMELDSSNVIDKLKAKLAEYRNALEFEHSCNWCLHSDDCTIRCENTVVCQEFERQTKGR